MKKILLIILPLVLIAGAFFLFGKNNSGTPAPAPQNLSSSSGGSVQSATITMRDSGYEPSRTTIRRGDTVTFVNAGSEARWPASNIHPTHEIYPEFDAKRPISPGQSWSFTFTKAGEWRYHDHLATSITGVIVIGE